MGRYQPEINPACGQRVKSLLKLLGTDQKGLAEAIFYTPQAVSRICTGKVKLTDQAAAAIAEYAAAHGIQVREEWLLGKDDYMTEEDKITESVDNARTSRDLLKQLAVCHGHKLSLFEVLEIRQGAKVISRAPGYTGRRTFFELCKSAGLIPEETTLAELTAGKGELRMETQRFLNVTAPDGSIYTFSPEEWAHTTEDISDYLCFRLSSRQAQDTRRRVMEELQQTASLLRERIERRNASG